jgi:predicted transcriptional regulator
MQDVPVHHSQAALEILEELGFAAKNSNGDIKITHPKLKMERHVPKCPPYDGKLSPTNGELFMKFPSSQNIQHVGGHCLSAYLAGYVASVDKVAKIHFI